MDITNLDYIAPAKLNHPYDSSIGDRARAPIVGGFGMGHFAGFSSRFNSLAVEPLSSSEISMLESFAENYADGQMPGGNSEFSIVDITTSTGPKNSSGHSVFQSIAGTGIFKDGGIFSFSSSASRAV